MCNVTRWPGGMTRYVALRANFTVATTPLRTAQRPGVAVETYSDYLGCEVRLAGRANCALYSGGSAPE